MKRRKPPAIQGRDIRGRPGIVAAIAIEPLPKRRIGAEDQPAFAPHQERLSAENRPRLQHRRGKGDARSDDQYIALFRVSQGFRNCPDRLPVSIEVAAAYPAARVHDPLGDPRRQGVPPHEQASPSLFGRIEGHELFETAARRDIFDQPRCKQRVSRKERRPDTLIDAKRSQLARDQIRLALRQGFPDGPQRRLAVFVITLGQQALANDAAVAQADGQQQPPEADDGRQPQAYRDIPSEPAYRGGGRRRNVAECRFQPLNQSPPNAFERIPHCPPDRGIACVFRLIQNRIVPRPQTVQHRVECTGCKADFVPLPQIPEQHRAPAGRLRDAAVEPLQAAADAQPQE